MALQREYDERVSAFVVDLLIASKSKQQLNDFFVQNSRRIQWVAERRVYEVYPLGIV